MEIMFDKCLRDILAKRGRTQRELAEHLLVSTQAVSKWCRGENMPDIALLPKIAYFLDVSVDELLGVGEIRKQEKIQEYCVKGKKLKNKGLIDEEIKLWREAYSEFPNDIGVINNLMGALFNSVSKDAKIYEEIISLGERILSESTDNCYREGAVQVLCYSHDELGNKEKALEYAKMGGSLWTSSLILMSDVLEGEEQKDLHESLLLNFLDLIGRTELCMCQNQDYERYLWLHEFYLKIMELYFDDGFYGFYACRAQQRHLWLARIYLGCRNDEQKTCEHLKAAARFARQYDDLSDEYVYTSTLLNGHKYNMENTSKNYTQTQSEWLLNDIRDSHFDSVRNKDWFIEILQELETAK